NADRAEDEIPEEDRNRNHTEEHRSQVEGGSDPETPADTAPAECGSGDGYLGRVRHELPPREAASGASLPDRPGRTDCRYRKESAAFRRDGRCARTSFSPSAHRTRAHR